MVKVKAVGKVGQLEINMHLAIEKQDGTVERSLLRRSETIRTPISEGDMIRRNDSIGGINVNPAGSKFPMRPLREIARSTSDPLDRVEPHFIMTK
jgi:hypothetical protein